MQGGVQVAMRPQRAAGRGVAQEVGWRGVKCRAGGRAGHRDDGGSRESGWKGFEKGEGEEWRVKAEFIRNPSWAETSLGARSQRTTILTIMHILVRISRTGPQPLDPLLVSPKL